MPAMQLSTPLLRHHHTIIARSSTSTSTASWPSRLHVHALQSPVTWTQHFVSACSSTSTHTHLHIHNPTLSPLLCSHHCIHTLETMGGEKEKERGSASGSQMDDDLPTVEPVDVELKDCPIDHVTVYSDRAEVERLVTIKLKEGVQDVRVNGLPTLADRDTVRLAGFSGDIGAITLLEVSSDEVKKDPSDEQLSEHDKKQKELESKLNDLQRQIVALRDRKLPLIKERQMLDQMADSYSRPTGEALVQAMRPETLEFMSKMFEFRANKRQELDEMEQKLNQEIKEKTAEQEEIELQIAQRAPSSKRVRRAVATLQARDNCEVTLLLTYGVSNASWHASYDIRVKSKDNSVQLTYNGQVRQNTGEDWKDARLSLSTATPHVGAVPPDLSRERIMVGHHPAHAAQLNSYSGIKKGKSKRGRSKAPNFVQQQAIQTNMVQNMMLPSAAAGAARDEITFSEDEDDGAWSESEEEEPVMDVSTADARTSGASSVFDIVRKANIECDNRFHKVTISIVSLSAEMTHYAVPSLNSHAYIKATMVNNSAFALLPGSIAVFFDGNYIAKSALSTTVSAQEEFSLYLGTDPAVKIQRLPVKKVHEKVGVIRSSDIDLFKFATAIKNTKQIPIRLIIKEVFPESTDDRIKIKLLVPPNLKTTERNSAKLGKDGDVRFIPDTSKLEWSVTVPPGKKMTVSYEYQVEHPSSISVYNSRG